MLPLWLLDPFERMHRMGSLKDAGWGDILWLWDAPSLGDLTWASPATAGAGVPSGAAPCQSLLVFPARHGVLGWVSGIGGTQQTRGHCGTFMLCSSSYGMSKVQVREWESCLLLIIAGMRRRRYLQNEIKSGFEWWLELIITYYWSC